MSKGEEKIAILEEVIACYLFLIAQARIQIASEQSPFPSGGIAQKELDEDAKQTVYCNNSINYNGKQPIMNLRTQNLFKCKTK